jgi:hypothetical protein
MAQTPKRKRTHLPKLSKDKLALIAQAVDKAPRLSAAGKRAVMRSLQAASSDNAESPEVVIASLPAERKETVLSHVKDFLTFGSGVASRGREKLAALSDAEFDALVNAANASGE